MSQTDRRSDRMRKLVDDSADRAHDEEESCFL